MEPWIDPDPLNTNVGSRFDLYNGFGKYFFDCQMNVSFAFRVLPVDLVLQSTQFFKLAATFAMPLNMLLYMIMMLNRWPLYLTIINKLVIPSLFLPYLPPLLFNGHLLTQLVPYFIFFDLIFNLPFHFQLMLFHLLFFNLHLENVLVCILIGFTLVELIFCYILKHV